MRRIGILTSGGDAPGMNAAIRAAVRTATSLGIAPVAYRDGFSGFVEGSYEPLGDPDVGNIVQRGGTFIGTSRCPEFLDPAVRAESVARMRDGGVDGLVVIGGDGSFRGAHALWAEHGVPVAGVPGTIDNDVWGTEETIGFHTAVDTAVRAVDRVRDTGESTGMMFFIEVMGRRNGAIALATAVACGAAAVFVPGVQEDIEVLSAQIEQAHQRGKRSHVIVVSEGDERGGAFEVAEAVGRRTQRPYRVTVLGHIQRGGDPAPRDRIVATWAGARAVEALAAGRGDIMIGMQGGVPVEVPLAAVAQHTVAPFDTGLLHLARQVAGYGIWRDEEGTG